MMEEELQRAMKKGSKLLLRKHRQPGIWSYRRLAPLAVRLVGGGQLNQNRRPRWDFTASEITRFTETR